MRKKLFWLLEIIIWLVVLSGITIYGVYYFNEKNNNQNTYEVLFDDADGLIVGSPVRVMGVQVGCVKNIKINNNKVDIVFKLDDVSMPLPQGAVATIQFTGMAGSKSLEILNSKDPNAKNKKLKVVEPIRIDKVYNVQEKISAMLINFTSNVLYIFDADNVQAAKEKMAQKRTISTTLLEKTGQIQGEISKYKGLPTKEISSFGQKVADIPIIKGKSPSYYLKDITNVVTETDPSKLAGDYSDSKSSKNSTGENIGKVSGRHVDNAMKSVDNMSQNLSEFSQNIKNMKNSPNVKNLESKLNDFNSTLQKLNRKKEVKNEN